MDKQTVEIQLALPAEFATARAIWDIADRMCAKHYVNPDGVIAIKVALFALTCVNCNGLGFTGVCQRTCPDCKDPRGVSTGFRDGVSPVVEPENEDNCQTCTSNKCLSARLETVGACPNWQAREPAPEPEENREPSPATWRMGNTRHRIAWHPAQCDWRLQYEIRDGEWGWRSLFGCGEIAEPTREAAQAALDQYGRAQEIWTPIPPEPEPEPEDQNCDDCVHGVYGVSSKDCYSCKTLLSHFERKKAGGFE